MNIRGLQKTSLLDFPGNVCATIFTGGCNLRCGYCHNRDLVCCPEKLPQYEEDQVLAFLQHGARRLDGVCISGGEPTLQPDLKAFITRIKAMGLLVKLDTNGTNPEMLKDLLPLLDYVAVDLKAPLEKYGLVVGTGVDPARIEETINILQAAQTPHEFRTTLVPLLSHKDIKKIRKLIPKEPYVLQQFRPGPTLIDSSLNKLRPYPPEKIVEIAQAAKAAVRGL